MPVQVPVRKDSGIRGVNGLGVDSIQNNFWEEYYAYSWENTSLTGGAGTTFADTIVRMDTDYDFMAYTRTHVATDDRIMVRILDDAYGSYWMNTALDLRTISGKASSVTGLVAGNSLIPYRLSYPRRINAGSTVTYSFADASGGGNSIRLTMHGSKIRAGQAPWDRQWDAVIPFTYSTGNQVISANGTVSLVLNINTDAHFRINRLTATRTGAALVTLKDGNTDRQWSDKAVHIDNMFGNSQFPHVLPQPRLIYRGNVMTIIVQDLTGNSNTVNLTFEGLKYYGVLPGVDLMY